VHEQDKWLTEVQMPSFSVDHMQTLLVHSYMELGIEYKFLSVSAEFVSSQTLPALVIYAYLEVHITGFRGNIPLKNSRSFSDVMGTQSIA